MKFFKSFSKQSLLASLLCLVPSLLAAQTVTFEVKEQQSGEVHRVSVDTSSKIIRATRNGGSVVYNYNYVRVGKDANGYIGFSFSQSAPVFRPTRDIRYFIVTERLMIGTKDVTENSSYQYLPVNQSAYDTAYNKLLAAVGGSTAGTPSQQTSTQQVRTFTVNGVQFKMVRVDGGTFSMGATKQQDSDAWDNEAPAHQVTLSTYYIGETEVTQELWQAVMGSNPSKFKGDRLPVESVSWDDCQEFVRKLNAITGQTFHLPTEAQWEFAARGGNKGRGYKFAGDRNIDDVAWYGGNSGNKTHEVATKQANELGLYDMSGNVWEWCQDWYGSYGSNSVTDPQGPSSGSYRVRRGGGWSFSARGCRVSFRIGSTPVYRDGNLGLRLAL